MRLHIAGSALPGFGKAAAFTQFKSQTQGNGSADAGLALVRRQSKPVEMEPTRGVGDPARPTTWAQQHAKLLPDPAWPLEQNSHARTELGGS